MDAPSYTQAALIAHASAAQASAPTATPSTVEIPPEMAKFIDPEAHIPVTKIQLDGLVVSKIIKHSRETVGSASGLLLGLDFDGTLEVTNSFAVPTSSESDEKPLKSSGGRYETTMLRVLKEAQYDDSVVGFYQSTSMGAFMRQSLISTQAAHHESLRQGGIVLVHDISRTAAGNTSVRAFRLTKAFLAANKAGKFSSQNLLEHQITFSTILEELPVTIRSSPLLGALLNSLSVSSTLLAAPSYAHLDAASPTSLTKPFDLLLESLDASRTEENNVAFHSRQIARERVRAEQYVAKKKEEAAQRAAQGLPPLPEEDVARLFKIAQDPSRLETTLLLGQVDAYARGLEAASGAAMVKLYASQA